MHSAYLTQLYTQSSQTLVRLLLQLEETHCNYATGMALPA